MNNSRLPYLVRVNPLFLIFGSLFLIVIPFLIWSNFAKLEQRSNTHGFVIPTAKTQNIQSAIDGVIEQILIKEGQLVRKGDLIISLEKKQNQASLDAIVAKIASLKIKLARLKAEVYGNKLSFPDDFVQNEYKDFITTQTKLYNINKKALKDEVDSLNDALVIKQEELKLNSSLVKSGDMGKIKLINIRKEISDIEGKILNVKNKYFQQAQEEMTKVEEELSINEQMKNEEEVTLTRSDIYAPMSGIVKNIIITTKGAKVRPGDVILEIVPIDDKLIIEAKLSPEDISFIKVGQRAAVKMDTYDFSIYGIFDGKVSYVSPDTLVEKGPEGDEHYFRVHIELDKTKLTSKNGENIEIAPGMGAQVDIITGERTVFMYLAKPVIKTLDESFIER